MNSGDKAGKLVWIPRVTSILFILFVSLFALDAFSGTAPVGEKVLGLLMYLIPSLVLLSILIASWKYPVFGGAAFIVTGIAFTVFFNTYRQAASFFAISAPPFVIGAMFILFSAPRVRRRDF